VTHTYYKSVYVYIWVSLTNRRWSQLDCAITFTTRRQTRNHSREYLLYKKSIHI